MKGIEELEARMYQLSLETSKREDRNFSDVLECLVCYEICKEPIPVFICSSGHLICGTCKDNSGANFKCPACKSRDIQRFEGFDNWAKKYEAYPCEYGCGTLAANLTKRLEHHSKCVEAIKKFKKCPIDSCRKEIAKNGFRLHLTSEHKDLCFGFGAQLSVEIERPDTKFGFMLGNKDVVVMFQFEQRHGFNSSVVLLEKSTNPLITSMENLYYNIVFESNDGKVKNLITDPILVEHALARPQIGFTAKYLEMNNFVKTENGKLGLTANFSFLRGIRREENLKWKALKCNHYQRNCLIVCPRVQCTRAFSCRLCHDADNNCLDHSIDRFKIREIICILCGFKQIPGEKCICCDCVLAKYVCKICNLYDDGENAKQEIFHCDECGICRRRVGAGVLYTHCKRCGICLPTSVKITHKCLPLSAKGACNVCNKENFASIDPIILLPCGHYVHQKCQQNSASCQECRRINMQ